MKKIGEIIIVIITVLNVPVINNECTIFKWNTGGHYINVIDSFALLIKF